MNKWFIHSQDLVKGPFTAEDVQVRMSSGDIRGTDLIWGPAQNEWRQVNWWTSNFTSIMAGAAHIAPIQEWHYSINGQAEGPFSRLELIHSLKQQKSLSEVLIWTNGMVAWAPIFEFSDLLSEVGVSRREFPRADIIGKAIIKTPTGTIDAELVNVSEGGFGVALTGGVLPGQLFAIEIQSPALKDTVHAKVECRYIANGITGFKFNHISVENKSTIIQYVKQYLAKSGGSSERAAA